MDNHSQRRAPLARRRWFLTTASASACIVVVGAGGFTAASYAGSGIRSGPAGYLATLNRERQSHGLAPLAFRRDLSTVAQRWAEHMAATGRLQHNPELGTAVGGWQSVGENVGVGPTVTDLARAFWLSSAHRNNILDPTYRDVGIGAVRRTGVLWLAVDFRDPLRSRTASTASRSTTRSSPRTSAPARTLSRGCVGADVAWLQRRLHVTADGIFGPITQSAVRRFQSRHGLVVDGIVGPRTRSALLR